MKIKIILIHIFILLVATESYTQSGSALGIGGFTAVSRGVRAVYWNPANLAFRHAAQPKFQMVLYALSVGTGNNSFDFYSLSKYIGDGESIYLTDQDKNDIINMIADRGLQFDIMGSGSLLSFSYKNFGVGIETKSYGNVSIPKDLYKNILFKLGQEIYDYSVSGGGFSVAKIKFSYGSTILKNVHSVLPLLNRIKFKQITAGISLSYLQGYGFAEIEKGQAGLVINSRGILPSIDFRAKYAGAGRGMGIDLGFGAITVKDWKIGVVFENLVNTMFWYKDTKMTTASLDFGTEPLFILGEGQLAEIKMESVSSDSVMEILPFNSRLPLAFRMGIAKDFGRYLLNFELGHENSRFSSALGGRIKFGIFNWFAAMGYSRDNLLWSTAVALDFKNFCVDIGVSSRGGMTLERSKALFVGSSMMFGF